MSADTIPHTLPTGYILNERYCIDAVLGEGGFGITYKAIDKSASGTRTYMAIKEYYPSGIATREVNGDNAYCVTHFGGKLAVSFRKGLNRFRQEAYLLKKFQNLQSIVTVLDIFDENNTTYIVMEYIEGLTIQKLVKKDGPMEYSDLLTLMKPLLTDLITIHENGLIHRDISPDNLLIGMDNRLHLIDFGSANHSNINASKTYTVILKAGYAPPEQYIPHGKIGAWTDVYGICATMFYALTGQIPTDSLQRMQSSDADISMHKKLSTVDKLEPFQCNCIMQGLSLTIQERYPSISIFLNSLTIPHQQDVTTKIQSTPITKVTNITKVKKAVYTIILLGVVIMCIRIIETINNNEIKMHNMKTSYEQDNTSDNSSNTDSLPASDITSEENDTSSSTSSDNDYTILTMVNLSGKTIEQASLILHNLDPNIKIQTTEEYSNIYNTGIIFNQSVREDTQFTKGDINKIVLTVSLGERPPLKSSSSESNNIPNDGYTTIHIGD